MSRLNDPTIPYTTTLAITDLFYTRVGAYTDSDNRKITAENLQAYVNAGIAGGKTVYGGVAANESLTLESTSHATKGYIKPNAPLYMKAASAASSYLIASNGQTFGATFDPFLILGYNYDGSTGLRINTSDSAQWLQFEGNYEHTRAAATVYDAEISYNIISTDGSKTRRPLGFSVNRDNPDLWCTWAMAIHKALNGRVEIVNVADQNERFYDFRYDGFFTITTSTPNISLNNGGVNGAKHIRSSGTSFQVVNSAYDTVILDLNNVGGLAVFGDLTISEAKNIVLGTTTGTKIGTSNTQKLAFFNSTPIVKPTVTGSKAANAALTSLLTQLAALGLVVDSST